MGELTFENLEHQMMQLYKDGDYAQAFELTQQEAHRFPEHEQELYYWRMCLASRLNNIPQALQFGQEALDRGHWFSPKWIHEDEDLQPLEGLPAFEQMLAICQQRLNEAQANVKPELLVIPPTKETHTSSQSYPLLLALHGNNDNAHSSVNYWRWITSQGWLLAVPQSAQLIGADAYVWDDWDQATREVKQHYTALAEQFAIDNEKTILGGFSMGGGLAIWLAMTGAVKARGFIALGPYLRDVEKLVSSLETAKTNNLRGYIVVGEDDHCLPIARRVTELLQGHGIPCEFELRPNLGHTFPPDFKQSLEKALTFIL